MLRLRPFTKNDAEYIHMAQVQEIFPQTAENYNITMQGLKIISAPFVMCSDIIIYIRL